VFVPIGGEQDKFDKETRQGSIELYLICKLNTTLQYHPTFILKLLEGFLKDNYNKSIKYELCVNSNIIIPVERGNKFLHILDNNLFLMNVS
jgi:hypothetical protein